MWSKSSTEVLGKPSYSKFWDDRMMLLEIVLWMSVGLVAYAYLGYALVLWGLSLFRCRRVSKADITPSVTFIITAYNEQSRIAGKLENTLKLTYPVSRLKVIVASDCSSDGTDEIVKSRSEEHTSELQSPCNLVCRLLLEKKKQTLTSRIIL